METDTCDGAQRAEQLQGSGKSSPPNTLKKKSQKKKIRIIKQDLFPQFKLVFVESVCRSQAESALLTEVPSLFSLFSQQKPRCCNNKQDKQDKSKCYSQAVVLEKALITSLLLPVFIILLCVRVAAGPSNSIP